MDDEFMSWAQGQTLVMAIWHRRSGAIFAQAVSFPVWVQGCVGIPAIPI